MEIKPSKLHIIIIILLVHFIINDEPIEIQNFGKYECSSRKTAVFIYNFNLDNPPQYEGNPYFYFGMFFSSGSPQIVIYEEGKMTYTALINVEDENKFYGYQIKNTTITNYTFRITSSGADLVFIDNTKEINTNLIDFLNINLETSGSYYYPSFPLIFNINNLDSKSAVKFGYKTYYEFYNSNYLLEICNLKETECDYKGIGANTVITFEKGEKYKIKYNCNEQYNYMIFSAINTYELNFYDLSLYQLSSSHKEQYFLLNIKNNNHFYIYVKSTDYYIYTKFITESDINNFVILEEDKYYETNRFDSSYTFLDFNNINKTNDYFAIKVKYDEYRKNQGYIVGFEKLYEFVSDFKIDLKKGEKVVIRYSYDHYRYLLVSSNKNMKKIDSDFDFNNLTDLIVTSSYQERNEVVFIDSSNEETKIVFYRAEYVYNAETKLNLYFDEDIKSYLDKFGPDFLFMRMNSFSSDLMFNVFYYYGITEKYYVYIKKYYGNINFYKSNKELDRFSNISDFESPYYLSMNEFDLIKDDIILISGFQMFTFFNSYNSFIDFYFQKEDDSEYININQNMFNFNNLVKILNPNKLYYLNFTVDHLIKLDNKFLKAEIKFKDLNGKEYILNQENKILKNLTGDNITMISNEKALIYFYKRINDSEIIELEFNKTEKEKLMKFDIINKNGEKININVIKDFGFSGYYPMISSRSWDKISGEENKYTVYIENIYDKLDTEDDLYENEGEKFIIYIYSKNKFEIDNITYINNLLTKKNKFNIEVISPNNNGSLILNMKNINFEYYQFAMCKSTEIKFNIQSSNGISPINEIITKSQDLCYHKNLGNEIMIHSFESDNEFLFSYTFNKYIFAPFTNHSIFSIFTTQKNILQIKFYPISDHFENYYILIAKKDDLNNFETFSDICYISKLFINDNFNSILVKKIFTKSTDENSNLIFDNINITKLNLDINTELIVTITSLKDISFDTFRFYWPKYTNTKIIKEIKFEEENYFNLENDYIFKFEYNPKFINGEQKLSLFFKGFGFYYMNIYLTYNDKMKQKVSTDYHIYFNILNPGEYYLEFYGLNIRPDEIKKGTFLIALTEKLIDIIDLSKKEYKNDKMYKISREIGPNYYLVNNLTENKIFNFTFDVNNKKTEKENPFIICNNDTDECEENIVYYQFIKGHNYTIYINYLLVYEAEGPFYYYPYFRFYNDKNNEEKDNNDNDDNNDLSSTTLAIIIASSVLGFIIIVLVLFFIIRYVRKKNENIDYKVNDLSNENLLKSQ